MDKKQKVRQPPVKVAPGEMPVHNTNGKRVGEVIELCFPASDDIVIATVRED